MVSKTRLKIDWWSTLYLLVGALLLLLVISPSATMTFGLLLFHLKLIFYNETTWEILSAGKISYMQLVLESELLKVICVGSVIDNHHQSHTHFQVDLHEI